MSDVFPVPPTVLPYYIGLSPLPTSLTDVSWPTHQASWAYLDPRADADWQHHIANNAFDRIGRIRLVEVWNGTARPGSMVRARHFVASYRIAGLLDAAGIGVPRGYSTSGDEYVEPLYLAGASRLDLLMLAAHWAETGHGIQEARHDG